MGKDESDEVDITWSSIKIFPGPEYQHRPTGLARSQRFEEKLIFKKRREHV